MHIYISCRVDENLCVKVADFGLAKDIYSTEYYRMSSHTKVPVKWMSPESLLDGFFNEKTDVVCIVCDYMMSVSLTTVFVTENIGE